MILAIDPDIPPSQQIVLFEAKAGQADVLWRLDGKTLPDSEATAKWHPKAGKHKLALESTDGHVIETVQFEVR